MSVKHTFEETIHVGGKSYTSQNEFTQGGEAIIDQEAVAADESDLLMVVAIDVSAMKTFFMLSGTDLTVKTNSSSTPDDTLTLKAGVPISWHENSNHSKPLTVDVTKIYVTEDGSKADFLTLRALQDVTP